MTLNRNDVKTIRQLTGKNQTAFAQLLGVSTIYQQKIEQGLKPLTAQYEQRIKNRLLNNDEGLIHVARLIQSKRGRY